MFEWTKTFGQFCTLVAGSDEKLAFNILQQQYNENCLLSTGTKQYLESNVYTHLNRKPLKGALLVCDDRDFLLFKASLLVCDGRDFMLFRVQVQKISYCCKKGCNSKIRCFI